MKQHGGGTGYMAPSLLSPEGKHRLQPNQEAGFTYTDETGNRVRRSFNWLLEGKRRFFTKIFFPSSTKYRFEGISDERKAEIHVDSTRRNMQPVRLSDYQGGRHRLREENQWPTSAQTAVMERA
jgi:hypothetical protein